MNEERRLLDGGLGLGWSERWLSHIPSSFRWILSSQGEARERVRLSEKVIPCRIFPKTPSWLEGQGELVGGCER